MAVRGTLVALGVGSHERYPKSDLPKILENLYAGILDDGAWDRAIVAITDSVQGSAALLLAFNPSTGTVLRKENHRLDPSALENYQRYWTFQDPRLAAAATVPTGEPMTELTLAMPDWGRTPILNEFLIPADCPHFMPVWLHKSSTKVVALSLQGSRKRGPFDKRDMENLKLVSPHVSRALEIRDRLEAASVTTRALTSCIDRVNFGVIALAHTGKILYANQMAERMIREVPALHTRSDGTLVLKHVHGSQLLRRWKDNSLSNGQHNQLFRIERSPGHWPINVVVTLPPEGPVLWVAASPAYVLFLFDTEKQVVPRTELVVAGLGVSDREAEIAALLSMGLEISEVSSRLGISVHTARTHLKSIYGKTGVRSQAQLVRRVLLGGSAHGPDLG